MSSLPRGSRLPQFEHLTPLPVSSAAGACACNDERGTGRYIYFLLGATSFWRYDVWRDSWQQLANPPTLTFAAGCAMTFDPSRNGIWLFAPLSSSPYCVFAFYDIASNTWNSMAVPSGLTAQWGTDACLSHTCPVYNPAGNDDYIYLIGNNSTTWYRYSVSANSWTIMSPSLPSTAVAGTALIWTWGFNPDSIYYFTATAGMYYYSISGSTFAYAYYTPMTETFSTGTCLAYNTKDKIYIVKDATHRIYAYIPQQNIMEPAGKIPYYSGTAIVGDGLAYVKTEDGTEYLYYRKHSGQEFWRMML
jgi:hypothetical protein